MKETICYYHRNNCGLVTKWEIKARDTGDTIITEAEYNEQKKEYLSKL